MWARSSTTTGTITRGSSPRSARRSASAARSSAGRGGTPLDTGRPVTLAFRGMVSCPHALASEAGVEVLKAGGSAVDAAIAASAVLSVVYPHTTGVGGDAFWLIHDTRRRAVRFLDAAGRAAAAATIDAFRSRGHTEI